MHCSTAAGFTGLVDDPGPGNYQEQLPWPITDAATSSWLITPGWHHDNRRAAGLSPCKQ